MNNKYIVSIEMIQDDECPIKGVINKIDDNKVIVSKLTEYGGWWRGNIKKRKYRHYFIFGSRWRRYTIIKKKVNSFLIYFLGNMFVKVAVSKNKKIRMCRSK